MLQFATAVKEEKRMSGAYEDYSKTVRSELRSLIGLFEGILSNPKSADEIKEQADQHLANMDQAADRYWQSRR